MRTILPLGRPMLLPLALNHETIGNEFERWLESLETRIQILLLFCFADHRTHNLNHRGLVRPTTGVSSAPVTTGCSASTRMATWSVPTCVTATSPVPTIDAACSNRWWPDTVMAPVDSTDSSGVTRGSPIRRCIPSSKPRATFTPSGYPQNRCCTARSSPTNLR